MTFSLRRTPGIFTARSRLLGPAELSTQPETEQLQHAVSIQRAFSSRQLLPGRIWSSGVVIQAGSLVRGEDIIKG